jgi:hypothetical protein
LLNHDKAQRQRLLLLFTPADHPHRDAVCATVAWVARDETSLFESYFSAATSGSHFGGGNPRHAQLPDLRGGTLVGGHHLEQLSIALQRFECEVVSLGPSPFDQFLRDAGIRFRADSSDVVTFYRQLFTNTSVAWPKTLLVLGHGGRPQHASLSPYGFPEIFRRRLLAIADGDKAALDSLAPGSQVETLWAGPVDGATRIESPPDLSVAAQTTWMAQRCSAWGRGFLLGDPELAARWIPTAARNAWIPIFGVPQSDVIELLREPLETNDVVFGRQQDDSDFLALSRLGVAFQLVDPGRPPFPVIREAPGTWPERPASHDDPSDEQLEEWARDGRILSTLLFWTGMVREIECLYALTDVLALTALRSGLILTAETFAYMRQPPLTMVGVERSAGGLFPYVELLLASGGIGALIESETPHDRFEKALAMATGDVKRSLREDGFPLGWWPVLDCPLVPRPRMRVGITRRAPFVRLRYRRRDAGANSTNDDKDSGLRDRLRSGLRESPARHFFEAERPFDGYRLGPPSRSILQAVRRSGFEYALTKAAGGQKPTTVSGADGLTVINHTVGRWGGWTPFVTVDSLDDLRRGERSLIRRGGPGWLLGTLDACLWAFTGPVWRRGGELQRMCELVAAGGASGRLVNVTPATVARYARLLERRGQVTTIEAV